MRWTLLLALVAGCDLIDKDGDDSGAPGTTDTATTTPTGTTTPAGTTTTGTTPTGTTDVPCGPEFEHAVAIDPLPDPSEAEMVLDSWVVRLDEASIEQPCPDPPAGWAAAEHPELFNVDPLIEEDHIAIYGDVPLSLGRYCLYTFIGGTAYDPDTFLTTFEVGPVFGAVIRDRPIAAPAGPLAEAWDVAFREAQEVGSGQLGSVQVEPANPVPKLVILDTARTGTRPWDAPPRPPTSEHGLVLSSLARSLVCDDPVTGPCAADVHSRLALPYATDGLGGIARNTDDGGEVGTLAWLAQSIRRETAAYLASPSPQPLVLNLSVAWHRHYGGTEPVPADFPPDVRAVWDAIGEARCRADAVIVAAAGNTSGGAAVQDDPLLPAAWASRTFNCVDIDPLDVRGVTPVVAVGGVDLADEDLANARPNARPPLVAYGDHAVGDPSLGAAPLTGSSVASAIAASTAAVLWHYLPDLDGEAVMAKLESSATPTAVDRGAAWPAGPSRRVRMCEVLTEACADPAPSATSCPGMADTSCARELASPPDLSTISQPQIVSTAGACFESPPECPGRTVILPDTDPTAPFPCVDQQRYAVGLRPWIDPQPQQGQCPACTLDLSGRSVLLEGDGILDDLTDPTLVIQYEGGGGTTSLLLQSGLFYVTGGVAFSLPATLDLEQVKNAGLAAQDGTVTVVSPLAIVD